MLSDELLTGDYDKNYDIFLSERADAILGAIRRHLTEPRAGLIPAMSRAEVAVDNGDPIDPEDAKLIAALIRAHRELERLRALH